MTKKQALVSIIMPAFNAAEFLPESIESILTQSYTNIELIIVDDGSTDNSWSVIKKYARQDSRIRAFRNKANLGVSQTANFAIKQARGQFLARMDADDISVQNRIEKQVNFLLKNPSITAVGCQCTMLDEQKNFIGIKSFPTTQKAIKQQIFWTLPIQQATLVINLKHLPKDFEWYDSSHSTAEEHILTFRLLSQYKIVNLKDNLYFYRQVYNSLSHVNVRKAFNIIFQSRLQAIRLGFRPTPADILINLVQFLVVYSLPEKTVNLLWFYIRGIRKAEPQYSVSVIPALEVKSN